MDRESAHDEMDSSRKNKAILSAANPTRNTAASNALQENLAIRPTPETPMIRMAVGPFPWDGC